ncbi:TatD family hydrolase, partial [Aerococcus sp. L_4]
MLFDTHTHLNVDDFNDDRDETITRARHAGVKGFALVGFNYNTINRA